MRVFGWRIARSSLGGKESSLKAGKQEARPMRKTTLALSVVLLAGLAAVAAVQGTGKATPSSHYDPATVETLKGTVEEVKLTSFGRGRMGGGVHLLVSSGEETVEVHLGPRYFLEDSDFEVEPGEEIEVTGSRVPMRGRSAVIAREITLGGYSLALRDSGGVPVWAGPAGSQSGTRATGRRGGRHRGCSHCGGCAGGCRGCGHHGCGHCSW
jgi:hypothetical protein